MANCVYLSQNIHDSMFNYVMSTRGGFRCEDGIKLYELQGIGNLWSSIKNGALSETLKKNGIEPGYIDSFVLKPGDILYVIQVKNVGAIRNYKNQKSLPPTAVLTINKYIAVE